MRRICGPKREELVGGWWRLPNEELHNFCDSPNIIKVINSRIRWVGNVTCIGDMRNAYKILVWKHEGKRPLGRPMHIWEYNIRMALREIEWEVVNWIHVAQDGDQWQALVNMAMNLWIPWNVRNLTEWLLVSHRWFHSMELISSVSPSVVSLVSLIR